MPSIRSTIARAVAAVGVGLGVGFGVGVAAMPAFAGVPTGSWTREDHEGERIVKDVASRNLVRIAFADLGLQDPPMPDDHRLIEAVLQVAGELRPDELILRWRLGAANVAGERDMAISLCRELLRMDPGDTVLQHVLITRQLESSGTVEERLRRLGRMLGSEGASLDPSLRSRLAMDAAFMCKQLGDEAGFVENLKLATSLDSTNRDAAAAAAAYFSERVDDPIGRLDLLANLLLSEPGDTETQIAISREVAAVGAFREAGRFQDNVIRMYEHSQIDIPPAIRLERMFTRWGADGPDDIVRELNAQVDAYRMSVARQIEQREKALVSTDGIPRPEDVRLEILTERLRLIAAAISGDSATALRSATDLRLTVEQRLLELQDPKLRPQDIDETRAAEIAATLRVGLIEILAWSDVYVAPGNGSGMDALVSSAPSAFGSPLEELLDLVQNRRVDPASTDFKVALGWSLLRAGRLDEAVTVLEQADDLRVGARLALAAVWTQRGETARAIEEYTLLWTSVPLTLEAMYAHTRLRELLGREDVNPDHARRARLFADSIPRWIDRMAEGGHTFMQLEVIASPPVVSALDRTMLKIRLRNLAPVPLGLGSDRTINSQVLVGSSVEIGLASVRAHLMPEATALSRRMRLMPNESVELLYWPDAGSAGWVAEECCDRLVRQRWRAIQGFIQREDGIIITGPMCLSRESSPQTRSPLPESVLSDEELAERFSHAGGRDLAALAMLIRARLLNPRHDSSRQPIRVEPDMIDRLARHAADRYPSLPAHERLLLLAVLPQASIVPQMRPFDEAARRETDPSVAVAVAFTRVTDPADEFLTRSSGSDDPRLSRFANLLVKRLESGLDGYAGRGGPDVRGIIIDSVARDAWSANYYGVPGR